MLIFVNIGGFVVLYGGLENRVIGFMGGRKITYMGYFRRRFGSLLLRLYQFTIFMEKIALYAAALFPILFFSLSCSKKSSPASVPVCKLTTIINDSGNEVDTINVAYGYGGKISSVSMKTPSASTARVFTYLGDLTLVYTTISNSPVITIDSIMTNSDGLMVSDLKLSGGDTTRTTFTYSGTQVQKIVTQNNSDPVITTTTTFVNGDLVSSSDGSSYVYDTGKPAAAGDYFQIVQLLATGVPFIKSAHQMVVYSTGSSLSNASYTYDNTGKITGLTVTSGALIQKYSVIYDCN